MVKAIEVISGWEKLHALIARSNIYAPEEVNNVEEYLYQQVQQEMLIKFTSIKRKP